MRILGIVAAALLPQMAMAEGAVYGSKPATTSANRGDTAREYTCQSVLNDMVQFDLSQPANASKGKVIFGGEPTEALVAWGFHNLTFVVVTGGNAVNITVNTDQGSYTMTARGQAPDFGKCTLKPATAAANS